MDSEAQAELERLRVEVALLRQQVKKPEPRLTYHRPKYVPCLWDDVAYLQGARFEPFCSQRCKDAAQKAKDEQRAQEKPRLTFEGGQDLKRRPDHTELPHQHPDLMPWDPLLGYGMELFWLDTVGEWDFTWESSADEPDWAEEWARRRWFEKEYLPTPRGARYPLTPQEQAHAREMRAQASYDTESYGVFGGW